MCLDCDDTGRRLGDSGVCPCSHGNDLARWRAKAEHLQAELDSMRQELIIAKADLGQASYALESCRSLSEQRREDLESLKETLLHHGISVLKVTT